MKAYISLSFANRKELEKETAAIKEALADCSIEAFVFTEKYQFGSTEEEQMMKQMMKQAMTDMEHCDLLIAEVSDKAIGIGVEAGYAKAKNKPVIYLRHVNAEHSSTVSGISDYRVIYTNPAGLKDQLKEILNIIMKK